ncbi:MAG: lysophospholipid acyltransferase family protein [Chloroflexota bacterium]
MNVQAFLNSRWGVGLGLVIGWLLPYRMGSHLGSLLADNIAKRQNIPVLKAIRLNQWVIRGKPSSASDLDTAVRNVLRHTVQTQFDLFYYQAHKKSFSSRVQLSLSLLELIENSQNWTSGEIVVAPHLSNFDLALQVAGYQGLKAQVLSHPNPTGAYRLQNEIREKAGYEVTPSSPEVLKMAAERLKKGGVVITGVDFPMPQKKDTLTFFGHPAPLPVGHIRLALEAEAPVRVASCWRFWDNRYRVDLSEPVTMQPHSDPYTALRKNAEAVLSVLEGLIRNNPDQWLMFFPVWKELMAQVP